MLETMDPIKFIQTKFQLKGQPFTLIDDKLENARHYLYGIYYTMAYKLPKVKKPMIIVKGRQVEMTTTITNIMAYFMQEYSHFPLLYAVPSTKQAKRFSSDKWTPLYRYRLDDTILAPLDEGTWTIELKKFANGSTLYTESIAEGGDNIRGISADGVVKDEFQDLDPKAEKIIDECLTHSKYKINIALGTPKYTETHFENTWKSSTQHKFHLKCPKCGKLFLLSLSSLVSGHIVRCGNCNHEEDKRILVRTGEWVPTGDPDALFIGYQLSQLYIPYITKEDIDKKIATITMQGGNVEQFIKNEVLGEFYEGERQKPAKVTIDTAFAQNMPYNVIVPVKVKTYGGVDWGGWSSVENDPEQSYTVFSTGTVDLHGKLYINYVEVIDKKDEIEKAERVIDLMGEHRVHLLIADSGYGKMQNALIGQKVGPGRFMACKYIQGNATNILDSQPEKALIKVNRDYSLEELYSAMGRGMVVIPRNEHTSWMIEQFMNHDIILIDQGNHVYKKFIKVQGYGKRVDAVHSINFLRLAALHDNHAFDQSPLAVGSLKLPGRPTAILAGGGSVPQDLRNQFLSQMPRRSTRPE